MKFEHRPNHFQEKLNKDVKNIRQETRIHVPGDKSTNFHKMAPQKYTELLEKSIQMEYKKATPNNQKYQDKPSKNQRGPGTTEKCVQNIRKRTSQHY